VWPPGHGELAEKVVGMGVSIDLRDEDGWTALMWASAEGMWQDGADLGERRRAWGGGGEAGGVGREHRPAS
jgi:hypothetical protein